MSSDSLAAHLKSGATTLCRAWKVVRKDGQALGFTDHDLDLVIEGMTYSARTGLSSSALHQTTGLAVDNSEAMGALSDAAVREEDILAGRYDDAEVSAYLVNWQDTEDRLVLFHGNFGEITREKGAFRVELRGLAERLNIAQGRAYLARCAAQFGDDKCKVNPEALGLVVEAVIQSVEGGRVFTLDSVPQIAAGVFAHGKLTVLDGAAAGVVAEVRADVGGLADRRVELWHAIVPAPQAGDRVRLVAGCDRRASTCLNRFANIVNFRGFPHIPGEDWLRRAPEAEGQA